MKFALAALALAAMATTAQAADFLDGKPTLSVEYDYHTNAGTPGHSQYGYIGLAQQTTLGTFDAGLQGLKATNPGFGTDNSQGFEIGYSYPVSVDKYRITPRIAYGALNQIEPAGSGFSLNARYALLSLEVAAPITKDLGGYVSYSHQNGTNADFGSPSNRVQAGVDFALTDKVALRTGVSFMRQAGFQQNGVVAIVSYGF